MRSRAVSRPFLCCDSMAFAPPPWRICSSSFLMVVNRSTRRRAFFSNSADFKFAEVFRTEADTQSPRTNAILKDFLKRRATRTSGTVYGYKPLLCESKRLAPIRKQGKLVPFQLVAKRASERFREIAAIKTKDDLLKQVGTALAARFLRYLRALSCRFRS